MPHITAAMAMPRPICGNVRCRPLCQSGKITNDNAIRMQLLTAIAPQNGTCGAVQGLNIINHNSAAIAIAVIMRAREDILLKNGAQNESETECDS